VVVLKARGITAAIIGVLLLLIPCMNASGTSCWMEDGDDFRNGENAGTVVKGSSLELGIDEGRANNWTLQSDGEPSRRFAAAMGYDRQNGLFVLFGGCGWRGGSPDYLSDTWTYDPQTNNWTQRFPKISPPLRAHAAMAYDESNGLVVLFGGSTGWSEYNDIWTYDILNNTWLTQPACSTAPSKRDYTAMVYDKKDGVMILFGGDYYDAKKDTWTYDLSSNTWTEMRPSVSPSGRMGHAMAFDEMAGQAILFGGTAYATGSDDTWAYNLSANTWVQKKPSSSPPGRAHHAMSYDSFDQKVVLFGGANGTDSSADKNDIWTYDSMNDIWTEQLPSPTPRGRRMHCMAYDDAGGRLTVFGGRDDHDDFGDTWGFILSKNIWADMTPRMAPPCRESAAMVYDSANDVLVLFGGYDGKTLLDDTWTYDLGTGLWTERKPPSSPKGRTHHRMVYDDVNGVCILFGGLSGFGGSSGNFMNDTWCYDTGTDEWKRIGSRSSPPSRCGHGMAFDSTNGVVVLFGGWTSGDRTLNDTWSFDYRTSSWTEKKPAASPSAREDSQMTWDGGRGRVVMYGGTVSGYRYCNETWEYNVTQNTWKELRPPVRPPEVAYTEMEYDSARSVIILIGGLDGHHVYNETWIFEPFTDSWRRINTTSAPSKRTDLAMAFDAGHSAMILFGGSDGSSQFLSDTWAFGLGRYLPSGEHTSAPLDTGGSSYIGSIRWNASLPAGTSVGFQLRTANTSAGLYSGSFVGPDGTAKTFYTRTGERSSRIHNASRWIQYRAYFTTSDTSITPALENVEIDYNIIHTLSIASPVGGENWTGLQDIAWSAGDGDGDILVFDIYLEGENGTTKLATNLPDWTGRWLWDTAGIPNGTYRIRMAARDDNPNIPLNVEATSDNFTIFHPPPPPPNRPPSVTLLSPANDSCLNATTVQLSWNGTDPDGDGLAYSVILSSQPFGVSASPRPLARTDGTSYTVSNLTYGTIYYWTVVAYDGKVNGPAADVWRFSLPPKNRAPRIISVPPSSVEAGKDYRYAPVAVDEDGDALNFSLGSNVDGISLDAATGKLIWTPSASQKGNHTVIIRVTDGKGGWDEQAFVILVLERPDSPKPPPVAPGCSIISPANMTRVKGKISIRGIAVRGSANIVNVSLRIDGGDWSVASGTENWSFGLDTASLPNGRHVVEARAFDGGLFSEPRSIDITVGNPKSGVTTDDLPFCLPVIVVFGGLAVAILSWRLSVERASPPGPGRNVP